MEKDFAIWFSKFCENNKVYLVTGSDRPKTLEQVGEYIYFKCRKVYQCSGNDIWSGDKLIMTREVEWPDDIDTFFEQALSQSQYPTRAGGHVDYRQGALNFSIVGRKAGPIQRQDYVWFEEMFSERPVIAQLFNNLYPDFQASVAGETGIDIFKRGHDKSQILSDFDPSDDIRFFGDKIASGGNDHEIALAVAERPCGSSYGVTGWENTWETLKGIIE
tara:strand:- start:85 stop:738 length:654 start_codon:yes stop_codon:yes gene_type:complete